MSKKAKTASKCVTISDTHAACSGHESTAQRDCKTMSIAQVITKHLPELAKHLTL